MKDRKEKERSKERKKKLNTGIDLQLNIDRKIEDNEQRKEELK